MANRRTSALLVAAATVAGCPGDWAHVRASRDGGDADVAPDAGSADSWAADAAAAESSMPATSDGGVQGASPTEAGANCGAGRVVCADACVSLDDPQHCGRCDRTCGSGTCTGGECAPYVVYRSERTGDAGLPLPIGAFTLSMNAVYVAPGATVIERVRATGGDRAVVTYGGADGPTSILADSSGLFELAQGRIVSFAFGANSAVELVPPGAGIAWHLASNSRSLFWSWGLTQNHLSRVAKAGGKATMLVNSPSITFADARADEANAYYTDSLGTLWRVPVDSDGGAAAEQVGAVPDGKPRALALTADAALVATSTGLYAIAKAVGSGTSTLSAVSAYALATDEQYAYTAHAIGDDANCTAGSELIAVLMVPPYTSRRVTKYSGGCMNGLQALGPALFWLDGPQIWRVEK